MSVWEFIGWLWFGDHLTVSAPSQAGLVVIGWWLRGKRDERRLIKEWHQWMDKQR